jgi:hypothetical protein
LKPYVGWILVGVIACVLAACAWSLHIDAKESPAIDLHLDVTDAKSPALGLGGDAETDVQIEEKEDDGAEPTTSP